MRDALNGLAVDGVTLSSLGIKTDQDKLDDVSDAAAERDLALQEAARGMYGLAERPGPKALRALAEPWAPWRAVAARGLWAYYRWAKGREGIS